MTESDLIPTAEHNATNAVEETTASSRKAKLQGRMRALLSNVKGSTTIEKIIIIAVFCFAIVGGVKVLATSTSTTLASQGADVLKFK
jgi:Flp pilus assembly pilin Flp